jgi:acetyl esterase/lipase
MAMSQTGTFLVVALLHCCSPIPVLNLLASRDDITVVQDVAYATGSRHTLDIYEPLKTAPNAPVVVFFYGGGWETGDKAMYRFIGAALATRGVVAVVPDYRLHPQVRFPAFMEDAAKAVAWTRANVARFGGDPDRLFLMGHSAGGQIATLLALDSEYLRAAGLSPDDVCGVIGLAGAYDFAPQKPAEFAAIFGSEPEWPKSRPINYVTKGSPPMLLLEGSADTVVEPGNTTRMTARLRAAGIEVHSDIYPGISHTALLAALAKPLTFLAPAQDDTMRFIAAHDVCERRPAIAVE